MDDIFYSSIAGINFRASDKNVGPILGYTQKNPVESDPEAIGCFLSDGSPIGFIPRARLEEFKKFEVEASNETGQCLFSGNIKKVIGKDGTSYFIGNIAIVKGDNIKELLESHYTEDFDLYGKTRPN